MQAIVTKYIGPTDTRGSRVSATAQAGRVSIGYESALSSEENHRTAAQKLADKMGWNGSLTSACLPNGDTVFVFTK